MRSELRQACLPLPSYTSRKNVITNGGFDEAVTIIELAKCIYWNLPMQVPSGTLRPRLALRLLLSRQVGASEDVKSQVEKCFALPCVPDASTRRSRASSHVS